MSEFVVEVLPLPSFTKHPNADRLFVTRIYDYPVIFNNANGFKEGDLVAYIPVDSVCPMTDDWAFLGDSKRSHRIKAKKLRGIFSMGMLTPAPEGSKLGDDVAEKLDIIKYDPPEPMQMGGEAEKDPGFAGKYTNIQNVRRYPDVIKPGEEVTCSEKIHGCCAMYAFRDGRLWARSHREYKKFDENNLWWKVAAQNDLEEKLKKIEGLCVFGEVFGQVQDLRYGAAQNEHFFRAFDVFSPEQGVYLNHDDAKKIVTDAGIPWVPEIYRGPFDIEMLKELAEEQSVLADNIREGVVIKAPVERFEDTVGRVVLKLISRRYLLRKKGSEYH